MKTSEIKVGITVEHNRNTNLSYKVVRITDGIAKVEAADGAVTEYTLNGLAKNFHEVIVFTQDQIRPALDISDAALAAADREARQAREAAETEARFNKTNAIQCDGNTIAAIQANTRTAVQDTNPEQGQKLCECGCGGVVKGKKSAYMMGHDARHKSALITQALKGNAEAISTLQVKGWYAHFVRKSEAIAAKEARKIANASNTVDATKLAKDLRAYASARYNKFGWSTIIECSTVEELAEEITRHLADKTYTNKAGMIKFYTKIYGGGEVVR